MTGRENNAQNTKEYETSNTLPDDLEKRQFRNTKDRDNNFVDINQNEDVSCFFNFQLYLKRLKEKGDDDEIVYSTPKTKEEGGEEKKPQYKDNRPPKHYNNRDNRREKEDYRDERRVHTTANEKEIDNDGFELVKEKN